MSHAFQEEVPYEARVTSTTVTYSKTGTTGLLIRFHTEYGPTFHTLWLTEGNRQNVYRVLDAIGVEQPERFNPERDGETLTGHKCLLIFGAEVYEGVARMKVKWVNPITHKVPDVAVQAAQAFFHAPPASSAMPVQRTPENYSVTDEDVPF